jgi:copper chaperone CopZ
MTMKKITLLLMILISVITLNAYGQADTTKTIQQDKVITLKIEGMSCEFCARGLKSSLQKLAGISIHGIDTKKGFAKVSFRRNNIPAGEILKDAIENTGFKLTEVQGKEKDNSEEEP